MSAAAYYRCNVLYSTVLYCTILYCTDPVQGAGHHVDPPSLLSSLLPLRVSSSPLQVRVAADVDAVATLVLAPVTH